MKQIKVGKSHIAFIDDEDFEEISKYKWNLFKCLNTFYARNRDKTRMHRIIMNAKKGEQVDHIDGDGLNNQKNNLRIASYSQNGANRKVVNKKYSKYLGVYKTHDKWQAATRKNKILYVAGYFDNEKDAALAYNKIAFLHHGEFAKLNVI